jgi:hypothetical protein
MSIECNEKPVSLYPELTEQGKMEAQRIMDRFKQEMANVAKEVLADFYTDVSYYVESDHWTNYRNALMNGLRGYTVGNVDNSYTYEQIRKAIYDNNKEEIIKDLNQDLVEENERLKNEIKKLLNDRRIF